MKRRNRQPELSLQIRIKQMLMHRLPPDIPWTASAAGARMYATAARKAKASGVRPGWPDLSFLCPDAITRYIEVKAGSSLSKEQRDFRDYCQARRPDMWAPARSVDDVIDALTSWGVALKPEVFDDERSEEEWQREIGF